MGLADIIPKEGLLGFYISCNMGIPGIPTGPTLPSLKLVVVSIITVIFNIVFFNNLGPLTSRPNETLYH